jgi:DNA-binding response OmpR family regulator
MSRILIVEDERSMQVGLRDNLEADQYEVDCVSDGKAGLERMVTGAYDLIILDVMLPAMSGFEVLKKGREKGVKTPVIMLTAKGEELDKVLGLELGADDYITKPFSLRELLARIKAVLRRHEPAAPAPGTMVLGETVVDFSTYTASRGGAEITMTAREFEVLKFLWAHKNQTVTRDQLLADVWGYDDSISTRTVDNFILKLRQKIERDPAKPKHILTMHGTGYRLVP